MAKIIPFDILMNISGKFDGGNSKEYLATNKCSNRIHLVKRVTPTRRLFKIYNILSFYCLDMTSKCVSVPFLMFGIFSASFLDHPSIVLRLTFDRSSFVPRSSFVHPPFVLRSFFDRSSIPERRMNGERTENERRMNGERTENERRTNGERMLLLQIFEQALQNHSS